MFKMHVFPENQRRKGGKAWGIDSNFRKMEYCGFIYFSVHTVSCVCIFLKGYF